MNQKINIIPNKEISVSIENVTFILLIDLNDEQLIEDGEQLTLHSHVSTELFACKKGKVDISINGDTVTLFKGDVAIVPPGVTHCQRLIDESSEVVALSFMCQGRAESDTSDVYKLLLPYVSGDEILVYRALSDFCEQVSEIVKTAKGDAGIFPALRMVELLLSLSSIKGKSEDEKKSYVKSTNESFDIQRMMRLDQIINRFYMYDLNVCWVARQLYISTRQLDRITRKRYGKTLHKVVMDKRIHSAEYLLRTSDMTVEKIGASVGFSSNVGFYREFLRCYGTTPAEYRRKLKG